MQTFEATLQHVSTGQILKFEIHPDCTCPNNTKNLAALLWGNNVKFEVSCPRIGLFETQTSKLRS